MIYSHAIADAQQKKAKQGGEWFIIKKKREYFAVHQRYLDNNPLPTGIWRRKEYKVIKEIGAE